jgi:hypothetical protein
MQRFVYSPKAYVFIKRRNGDVADVSRYVTAGSVNRRVNAVSTANFSLRNPNMLFTASGGRHAAFFPMDPVTIYLQRLKDRPVRVFTGYLDETPYYELYPGVIELSASCTLKKLLYTYFDPALPYTQSFLAEYGWLPGPDGTVYNPEAASGIETSKDGGMGALLFATLQQIGHWKEANIKIEKLPDDLIKRMTNMMRNFEEDNREARAELETLITRFIGAGDYGSSGKDTSDVDVSKYEGDVAEVIYQVGKAMGVSVKFMLSAFETGIVESGMRNLNYGDADSKGWRQERVSIYGESATDVNASAKRYFQECKQFDKGSGQSAGQLSADVQRPREDLRGRYDEVRAAATSLMEKTRAKVEGKDDKNSSGDTGSGGPEGNGKTTQAKRRDGRADKTSGKDAANRAKLSKTVDVHGAQPGMQPIALLAASYGLQITAGKNDHSTTTSSGNVSDHSTGSALDLSNGTAPTKEMDAFNKFVKDKLGPITKQLIWRDTDQHKGYPIPGHMNHVHVALLPEFASSKEKTINAVVDALAGRDIDVPDTSDGTDDSGSGGSGDSGILSRANATALAINLNWADFTTGQIESVALQGNKSLMNDKPLMPFIQQMSESSLRQFMSMPNGDFFAFYPDYFGETFHRPPYWIIDDIEVLEGSVRLNDAALVTHEYAIGETSFTSDQLTNRLLSQGAISITNAFQSGLVTTEADKKRTDKDKATREQFTAFNRALKQDEAVQFLERYGARPDVQDFPFIRNPFFEMFMAYQRFMQAWSRQFISPFKLTFMPELYPGGKVGFPEHGLQMYVEEVTHTWDYSTGFVTEADLSSPAAMVDSKGHPISNNLPPNMPTALLEVAVEKNRGGSDSNPLITPGPNGELRPN